MPDWTAAETSLESVYRKHYPALLNRGAADVSADLGRDVAINPTDADKIMAQIGARVKGVVDTQQDRIKELVNAYQDDAAGLRAALQEALDTTELRAGVIATTETHTAYNQGRVGAMQSAGLKHVLVFDGDEDEVCAAVNNTRQTLDWAQANPLGHPNCSRSFELDPDEV